MIRNIVCLAAILGLAACSGSGFGGSNNLPGSNYCDPQTQVQLANPTQGQNGASPTSGSVIIVANGSNNVLNQNPGGWNLLLTSNGFGGPVNGSSLSAIPYPQGPHPFGSDFYYSSSIPALNSGVTYTVYLGQTNGSCQSIAIGTFST